MLHAFVLIDAEQDTPLPLPQILACDEDQFLLRGQELLVPRLARLAGLAAPAGTPWRLDSVARGTLDGLALVPCPEAAGPLGPGQSVMGLLRPQ